MEYSSLFVIVYFGVIAVHSEIVKILGDEYYLSKVKTYSGPPPVSMQFRYVSGISSVIVIMNVGGDGYYIGPVERLGRMTRMAYYVPTARNNFTDEFGNTLFCEKGEVEIKRTKKRYKIRIGPSAHILECYLDSDKRSVFLVSGKTRNATSGRLYAFNIKDVGTKGNYVLTEEIVDVGDNITAVTVGHHVADMGIILLSESAPDKNSFNILIYKERSKTFHSATEQAAIKIKNHFNKVMQGRVNRLANDNLRLRLILQKELKNIQNISEGLPEKVSDTRSTPRYAELEKVFDNMRDRMKLLYERNILGKDATIYSVLGNRTRKDGIIPLPQPAPETFRCANRTKEYERLFKCAPEDQFENKIKDYLVSEKAFVEIQEWLRTAANDTKGILGVINILGHDFEVNEPRNHYSDTQSFLEYQSEIFGLIGSKFKTQPLALHNPETKSFDRKISLSFGNELNCDSDGRATFVDKNTNPNKNYVVKTGNSSFTFQCYADIQRNRAFLLSGNGFNASKGKLYAIETSEVDVVNGEVVSEEIADVGDNISVITVRDSDGVILLSQEVTGAEEKVYKMLLLKPTSQELVTFDKRLTASDFLTAASANSSKLYSTYDPEESEFIEAIVEAENNLVSILKEKWTTRSEKLLDEQKKLRTFGEILMSYYVKVNDDASRYNLFQSMVSLLALNDTSGKSTFEDELTGFIEETGNNLFKKYIKERTLIESDFNLLNLEVVCDPDFRNLVTQKDLWYSCVRKREWRDREKFHEKLKSFYDKIIELDTL